MSATITTKAYTYESIEAIYKELNQLSKEDCYSRYDRTLRSIYPLVLHSNYLRVKAAIKSLKEYLKLRKIIKIEEKLPLQDSSLATGHLDDLIEIAEDLKIIVWDFNEDTLKEIVEKLALIVDCDGAE